MRAYSQTFRVETLGPKLELEPGTVILVTHRRETDVPLICPPLYFGATMRTNLRGRMSFAARDDMFLPGFFAGFPPDLPRWARRLLYGVAVARWLPVVNVYPIRSARVAIKSIRESADKGDEMKKLREEVDKLTDDNRGLRDRLDKIESKLG